MRQRKKELGQFPISVRLWTLKDKDGLFRAKDPDKHIVEIVATKPKGGTVIIREFVFEKAQAATDHYEHLLRCFDYSKKGK